ncbi:MAG: immunity 22 family protein [Spirulina sp.]
MMETSHIWLGNFPSADALEKYFAETYDEDDDGTPLNQFAADQGEHFYDSDWVEFSYSQTTTYLKRTFYDLNFLARCS